VGPHVLIADLADVEQTGPFYAGGSPVGGT
jgi:hypothetical protein